MFLSGRSMARAPFRILLLLLGSTATHFASYVDYSGGVYQQAFDSLPAAAHNSGGHAWEPGVTVPGWHASRSTYSVTDGTLGGGASAFVVASVPANVGLISFGAAGSAERALGLRSTSNVSGHDPVLLGVRFINQTQSTFNQLSIAYTGEQWLQADHTSTHHLLVEYRLTPAWLTDHSEWIEVPAARFASPRNGGTALALDGNAPAHRARISALVKGISWAPGQVLWVRFRDSNEPGNEHGLAVDEFSLEASVAPPALVVRPWSGNVTPSGATIVAAVDRPGVSVRAVASLSPDFTSPIVSAPVLSSADDGNAVRLDLVGLSPDTEYHYALSLDGVLDTSAGNVGRFRSFPAPGPASFQIGFGACGHWSAEPQHVYDALAAEAIRLFIHMGDLNYADTDSRNPADYRVNYRDALAIGRQGALLRRHASAYMWDDHDFSGDDSDRTFAGRLAHRQVYRELAPHYSLPDIPGAGEPHGAIYQAFTLGRVRFILSDLRSERDPVHWADNASKTMMGAAQKAWFKQQLLDARDSETPLIVWVSTVPFISMETNRDNWGRYRTERTELLEFIRDQRIQNIVILAGDMHALAADDGRGTEAYVPGVRIPVFHAASFNRAGSVKGGPYSHGASPGDSRYGLLAVADDGAAPLRVTYRGRIARSATEVDTWLELAHETEPVRPRAPAGLAAKPSGEGVALSWADRSGVESGFRVERAFAVEGPWTPLAVLPADAEGFHDTSAAPSSNYAYRVIAVNQDVEAEPTAPVEIVTPGGFSRWKLCWFGDASTADDDDRDGDGRPALLEYALGGDPLHADDAPGYAVGAHQVGDDLHLALAFTRLPENSDLRYLVQAGSDLGVWNEIARSERGEPLTGEAEVSGDGPGSHPRVVVVRDPVPLSSVSPRRFLRLRAER